MSMPSHPFLTIGIPTYNGSAFIREALDSIANQLDSSIRDRVEILVSDNASTDETGNIVREFELSRGIGVSYFRNEQNVGYDANVDLLFKRALGNFVWTVGDDDVLEPGSLTQILRVLDKYPQLTAIQVNFDKYNRTLDKVVDKCPMPSDVLCQDAETFLKNSHGRYGSLSAIIINRDTWNREDLSAAFGSLVIHMYGLVQVILRGSSYLIASSLIKVRDGSINSQRADGGATLKIALTSGYLYHAMLQMGYSKQLVNWHLKADRPYVFSAIPRAKYDGIRNKMEITMMLIKVHNSASLWLRWIPLIFLPDSLFRPIYQLKKRISSKTRFIEKNLKTYLKRSH